MQHQKKRNGSYRVCMGETNGLKTHMPPEKKGIIKCPDPKYTGLSSAAGMRRKVSSLPTDVPSMAHNKLEGAMSSRAGDPAVLAGGGVGSGVHFRPSSASQRALRAHSTW